MKVTLTALLLFLTPIIASFGLPPTLVLGGFGGAGSFSLSPTPKTPYTNAGVRESFGWRQSLGSGSYLSLASKASLAPYLTTLSGYLDSEAVDAELGLPSGPNSLIVAGGFRSSLENQSGYGSYIVPYWSGEYRFRRSAGGLQPSLTYGGRYVYQQLGSDNHFVEALRLKLDQSTTVRFDGFLGLDTAWELWPQQPILSSTGSTTGKLRQDELVSLSAGARGLAGYTLDWQAGISAGVRLSNANEYLTTVSKLEPGSQTRLTQKGNFSVTWTPTRSLSATLTAEVANDAYLTRNALTSSGTPTSANLDVVSAGGGAKVSWTPDGKTYFVLRGNAARTFANDPSFPAWSYDVSGGVDYSF